MTFLLISSPNQKDEADGETADPFLFSAFGPPLSPRLGDVNKSGPVSVRLF